MLWKSCTTCPFRFFTLRSIFLLLLVLCLCLCVTCLLLLLLRCVCLDDFYPFRTVSGLNRSVYFIALTLRHQSWTKRSLVLVIWKELMQFLIFSLEPWRPNQMLNSSTIKANFWRKIIKQFRTRSRQEIRPEKVTDFTFFDQRKPGAVLVGDLHFFSCGVVCKLLQKTDWTSELNLSLNVSLSLSLWKLGIFWNSLKNTPQLEKCRSPTKTAPKTYYIVVELDLQKVLAV